MGGEPLVARVVRRVRRAEVASSVLVATDDPRIAAVAEAAGAEVVLDPNPRACGSDRVAAAVSGRPADLVLNVQGDEALVDRAVLRAAVQAAEGCELGTVAAPLEGPHQLQQPDTVKVALGPDGRAAGFFRRWPGDRRETPWIHLGIYSFWPRALECFAALPPSPAERAEGLEQLRALEAGMQIGVRVVEGTFASVNRPGDVQRVEQILAPGGQVARGGA